MILNVMNSLKILSLKMAKIEKEFPILKKLIIWLFKYIKTKSPLPFLGKLGYFLHFWVEKRWASQVKCSQSKFKTAYSTQIVVDQLNPPKSCFQFCGCRCQATYQINLTPVFASLAALLETTSAFVKENDL